MSEIVFEPSSRVFATPRFICVWTQSGYSSRRIDYKGRQTFLPIEVNDEDLGHAVNEAPSASRFVVPRMADGVPEGIEVDPDLFNYKSNIERYDAWIEQTCSRFGFRSRRALFKDMRQSFVDVKKTDLLIRPTFHEKLELWTHSDELAKHDVVVSPKARAGRHRQRLANGIESLYLNSFNSPS